YELIRPFGRSDLPEVPKYPENERKLPVLVNYKSTVQFTKILDDFQVKYKLLPKKYGGPTALKQFKAFISLPYQVSTMKLYENLAQGVVSLVPSPRFLRILMSQPQFDFTPSSTTQDLGINFWFKFIEFYNKDLKKFYYTFDSVEELKEILESVNFDAEGRGAKAKIFW
ncbi:hypothetical protein HK099_002702, partial [Clydaea vesicula]